MSRADLASQRGRIRYDRALPSAAEHNKAIKEVVYESQLSVDPVKSQ